MPPSKKRKISVPTKTDKEASQGPNHPKPETMQSEEQRPSAIESLASEPDQDAGNRTIANKERQERFRILQARAVGIPSAIPHSHQGVASQINQGLALRPQLTFRVEDIRSKEFERSRRRSATTSYRPKPSVLPLPQAGLCIT